MTMMTGRVIEVMEARPFHSYRQYDYSLKVPCPWHELIKVNSCVLSMSGRPDRT